MPSRRNAAGLEGFIAFYPAASAVGIFGLSALTGALVLTGCLASGCNRDTQSQATTGLSASEQPGAEASVDDKLRPARAAIDKVTAQLEALAQTAEAAQGDRDQLVPIDAQFQAALRQAKLDLLPWTKRGSDDDQRALQRYYALRIGPPLSRLQVLVFPARMVALPVGATPAALPTAATVP